MAGPPEIPALDEEAFRDLAQSSHRLWRTIEFEQTNRDRGPVHAWIRRPFDLRVAAADGTITVEDSRSTLPRAMLWAVFDGTDDRMPVRYTESPEVVPQLAGPTHDSEAPEDDPMYENYQWVAMLQPRELAVGGLNEAAYEAAIAAGIDPETAQAPGVLIDRLWPQQRNGRDTWWAELSPDDDTYAPWCGCCPLLLSENGMRLEYGDTPWPSRRTDPAYAYTTRFRVALDVETGLCVSVEHLDGSEIGEDFSVRILEVDQPMSDELFA